MLDRSKPFGQIYPPHRGACYEQGGRYFGAQGQHLAELDPEVLEVDEDAPTPSDQVAARKKPGPKPKMPIEPDVIVTSVVSDQVAAQLGDDA